MERHRTIVAITGHTPTGRLEAVMADTSRRTFVSGLVAGLPTLAYASAQPALPAPDPVWTQIMSDLRRIYGELKADSSRRDGIRALESTIRMQAAYAASLGHVGLIQRGVAQRLRRDRTGFVAELQRQLDDRDHRHAEIQRWLPNLDPTVRVARPLSADEIAATVDVVAKGGYVALMNDVADALRQLADQRAPVLRVRSYERAQWDPCQNLAWQISLLETLGVIVCSMAYFNPVFIPECLAIGATVAALNLAYEFFC